MSRYIALDVEQNHLYLASVNVKGNVLKFEKVFSLSNSGPLTGSNTAELGRRVKEAMKEAGVAPAPALFSIGRERVVLKEVKYPASVSPADEPALIKFQVSKDIAEGGDNVVVDYFALPTPDPDGQRRALAFALRKDSINAIRAVCIASGLKLVGITPRPFGIAASLLKAVKDGAVNPPDSGNTAIGVLVHGDKWGELVILQGGNVAFTRALTTTARNSETALLGEIRRNLAVFVGQGPHNQVQALYVAEGEMLGGWSGRISAGLNIPVQSFDPIADVETDVAPEQHSSFAGPIGLAALHAAMKLPINFIAPREPKPQSDPNKRLIGLIAVAASLLFIGGLAIGWFLVREKEKTVTSLQNQKSDLEEDLKKLEIVSKRTKAVKDWEDHGVNWLDELYDLDARFPDPAGTEIVQFYGIPIEQGGKANTRYSAELDLTILTESGKFVDSLAISMAQDRHYSVGGKQSKGAAAGRGFRRKNEQYLLKALIEHREAKDYELKSYVEPVTKRDRGNAVPMDSNLFGGAGQFGGPP